MNNLSLKPGLSPGQRVKLRREQQAVVSISGGRSDRRTFPEGIEVTVCDTMRDLVLVREGSWIFFVHFSDVEVGL